jgi:hypothetical protein
MRAICKTVVLLGLLGVGTHGAHAQAIAESGAMTSHSAIAAQSAKPLSPTTASSAKQNTSPHLAEQTGPPRDEVNRQDFEDNAGEKAGKLLLRSVPSGAEIFINGLLVGRTPMLMVIAPGKYTIEMRGPRQESGHSTIGVMPKETQTVVINLNQRYPASIAIR